LVGTEILEDPRIQDLRIMVEKDYGFRIMVWIMVIVEGLWSGS
tara:strand:+ start:107 stop:235 length:129 start_codon:yes stop_codon:yes gene_type:complete